MATKNMFEKLKMNDKEDEEQRQTVQKQEAPQKEAPKKKKVRPQENKTDNKEGFFEVSKKNKGKPQDDDFSQDKKPEKRHFENKGAFHVRGGRGRGVFRGKREYERHSGTGRGKEIAKKGAGNAFVVGNEKTDIDNVLSKHQDIDKEYFDDLYEVDLTKKVELEETPVENKEDKNEEKTPEENKHKKFEVTLTEEEKKQILEIPENAMGYEEYKNKVRGNVNVEVKAEIKHVEREDKENILTTSDPFQKKKKQPKEKKEVEKNVHVELNIGSEDVQYDKYDSKKQYNKKQHKKPKASAGFKPDMEDFPTLG